MNETNTIITQYVNKIWEETDGCANKYRRETYIYLLSNISVKFNLIIDCDVGALGHGKYGSDGLNAVYKQYLNKAIFLIGHT